MENTPMKCFLTDSFFDVLPEIIEHARTELLTLAEQNDSDYSYFIKAIKSGLLQAYLSKENSTEERLNNLRQSNPIVHNWIVGLISAGKLKLGTSGVLQKTELPEIQRKDSEQIEKGLGLEQNIEIIFHGPTSQGNKEPEFMYDKDRRDVMEVIKIPLILSKELKDNKTTFLFGIKSDYTRRNSTRKMGFGNFWKDFIKKQISLEVPYKKVRILDPYLYNNIKNDSKHLQQIIEPLLRLNDTVGIEIISGDKGTRKEEIVNKLQESRLFKNLNIKFYRQLSDSGSNTFHRRVIWTNLWVIQSDRGLAAADIIGKENDFFVVGRLNADKSVWSNIAKNWNDNFIHPEYTELILEYSNDPIRA